MKWLNRLEMKFGRFAIRNLMQYIVLGCAAVYVMCLFNSSFITYLHLIPQYVFRGQIWRVVTFLFIPPSGSYMDFLLVLISLYFYYFVGKMLEGNWGAFKFNVYYLIGVLCTIIMSLATGLIGFNEFLNESLFLAFATLYPDVQVLLFLFIPIKVRWLGYLSAGLLFYQFLTGGLGVKLMILASLVNYLLFFGPVIWRTIRSFFVQRKWERITRSFSQKGSTSGNRRPQGNTMNWSNPYADRQEKGKVVKGAFHRCQICGKTELDDPSMQFRYCADCDGAIEYCMDHLYNHSHIKTNG